MKGLEISKKFFEEYGLPMIENEFPDIKGKLAAGLAGSGSECSGYDDDLSRDHDFEPGFIIFVPDDLDSRTEFRLERAYAKLPKEFMGLKRSTINPVGGNRHGVIHTSDFFRDKTGSPDGQLDLTDWFFVPENSVLEAVNGEIFMDNYGEVTRIRENLSYMPEDARLKKLAGHILNMAQSGQYNYGRCAARGETAAAQLAICEFVKSTMCVIFLLNKKYMPYYKWTFRALKDLPILSDMSVDLEFLISSTNTEEMIPIKTEITEEIAEKVIEVLHDQGITEATCNDLEKHAYSVNDFIKDSSLRNKHIMYAL